MDILRSRKLYKLKIFQIRLHQFKKRGGRRENRKDGWNGDVCWYTDFIWWVIWGINKLLKHQLDSIPNSYQIILSCSAIRYYHRYTDIPMFFSEYLWEILGIWWSFSIKFANICSVCFSEPSLCFIHFFIKKNPLKTMII